MVMNQRQNKKNSKPRPKMKGQVGESRIKVIEKNYNWGLYVYKKANGTILFTCNNIENISEAIQKTIATGEGQTVWLKSIGTNKQGVTVAEMEFEWSIKLKV